MCFFDGSEEEIGRGAQAVVYAYKGFAYKVYNQKYPTKWIEGEYRIQDEVNKTDLPVVKYYKTEQTHIVKMDLLEGMTLGGYMHQENTEESLDTIVMLQKKIHRYQYPALPSFRVEAIKSIHGLVIEEHKKRRLLKIIEVINEAEYLLHLDFHPLNIIRTNNDEYFIIDWANARKGNRVFDYARTYVILQEFSKCLGQQYLTLIVKDKMIDTSYLNEAIYLMAMLRIKETSNKETLDLIKCLEKGENDDEV